MGPIVEELAFVLTVIACFSQQSYDLLRFILAAALFGSKFERL